MYPTYQTLKWRLLVSHYSSGKATLWHLGDTNSTHLLMNYLEWHFESLRRWPTAPALSSAGTEERERATLRPHAGSHSRMLSERKSPAPVPTCRTTPCGICSRLLHITWTERNNLGCRTAREGREIKNSKGCLVIDDCVSMGCAVRSLGCGSISLPRRGQL